MLSVKQAGSPRQMSIFVFQSVGQEFPSCLYSRSSELSHVQQLKRGVHPFRTRKLKTFPDPNVTSPKRWQCLLQMSLVRGMQRVEMLGGKQGRRGGNKGKEVRS